jgi:uncharacterized protein (DUF2267 family)
MNQAGMRREKVMNQASIPAFESTLQTTHIWLSDIMEELPCADKHYAYHALTAVLHAVRDRLTVEAAAALGAQLPLLIRGAYYEGWHPHGKPLKARKKNEFLDAIDSELGFMMAENTQRIAATVLSVLEKHVSAGEIENVKNALPHEIRSLWTEQMRTVWT